MPDLSSFDRNFVNKPDAAARSDSPSKIGSAIEFAHQSQRLAQFTHEQEKEQEFPIGSTQAVEAKFITAQDPVIVTANGGRLPAVPIHEALELNRLKDQLEDRDTDGGVPVPSCTRTARDGTVHGLGHEHSRRPSDAANEPNTDSGAPLGQATPPSQTNPLFPPLRTYGPSKMARTLQCCIFRSSSAVLSFLFLLIVVLGAAFTSIPKLANRIRMHLTFQNPSKARPFHEEEMRRRKARGQADQKWQQAKKHKHGASEKNLCDLEKDEELETLENEEFVPTEGGSDPLVCDVGYYARRVGLDVETFDVETEDGFIIELWHVFNPRGSKPSPESAHAARGPTVFQTQPTDPGAGPTQHQYPSGHKKYPVLMIHGLLQSSGAYCCTDDDSLAFYLAKSGYDVWLGNNRCGTKPRHVLLDYSDPRMWAWNIRQMGVLDLPALISRVLAETGFPKLGLVCHSQGTTQTLVALAKEQRPEIGEKISVFCALAPAAYAGPLIGKAYFKFMYTITPGMFNLIFGIHAFIPFMMEMHKILPARFYGGMGYRVFSFLFNWTDTRWERDLRDRMFQFAPVYVSAESMRWWLGRECFAKQKCILATREEWMMEDEEDEEEDHIIKKYYEGAPTDTERSSRSQQAEPANGVAAGRVPSRENSKERGQFAWYNEQFPPIALWVAGADDLVDGRRLLRRFDRGREPHVKVVHKKIIEGYEHLDVIWAMDSIEKVGKEVKEVIWRTAPSESRAVCRTPKGCEDIAFTEEQHIASAQVNGKKQHRQQKNVSNGVSDEALADAVEMDDGSSLASHNPDQTASTQIDVTAGEWTEQLREDKRTRQLVANGKQREQKI